MTEPNHLVSNIHDQENSNSSSIPNCVDKWVNNIHEQNVQSGQESVANIEPHLEMKFDSEAAAYEFYNEYSKRNGKGDMLN
ncbi:protein FAR1-RELATED SEQUENCE [Trifolium repens]|nr:protein FAR1-RELATED SEQUENCE [Trifolium repens]